jgi:exosortase A-associated hydrolase 2
MRFVSETPHYFRGAAGNIFGVLHEPDGPGPVPFVFCHAFAEEKLWTHRVLVSFARVLAERGHPVLRFDCMGTGDSEGHFRDSSLETMLADASAAIEHVKARTGSMRVALLGLRLGASLATLVAERRNDIARVVAWAPILNGTQYMQEMLRINLVTQMAVYREAREDRDALVLTLKRGGTVNVDGYQLTGPMFEQVAAMNLLAEPRQFAGPVLLAQIERAATVPAKDLLALHAAYGQANAVVVAEEPFWKEIKRFYGRAPNLFAHTLSWLEQT